jgi:hypothetical protein
MTTYRIIAAAGTAAMFMLAPVGADAQVLGPAPQPQNATPAADWRAAPDALKLRPIGGSERKREHSEVEALTEAGRRVSVTFDRQGRISEIEDEEHEHPQGRLLQDGSGAVEAVRKAGFGNPFLIDAKRRHAVVRGTMNTGDAVNLHVDADGFIYRQIWVR